MAIAVVGSAVLVVFSSQHFGSWESFLAYRRGEAIYVREPVQSLRVVSSSSPLGAEFEIQNVLFLRPVTVHAAETSCGCVVTSDLPLTIPPGEVGTIRFSIRHPATEASRVIDESLALYTVPASRGVVCRIFGEVSSNAAEFAEGVSTKPAMVGVGR